MNILQRLKLELNNQQLLTDSEYITLLSENNLTSTDTYKKDSHQRSLLYTCIDVLEIMSNDTDAYRKIATEFLTTDSALSNLTKRIEIIKQRIYDLPSEQKQDSIVSMMFYNR